MKTLLFTCYSAVVLFGELPTLDRIVKNIQPAYQVHSPTHRVEKKDLVSISFLVSSSHIDRSKAKEMVAADWVKEVMAITNSGKTETSVRYLGCTSQDLVP